MKDLRDLKDLTMHGVQPISDDYSKEISTENPVEISVDKMC